MNYVFIKAWERLKPIIFFIELQTYEVEIYQDSFKQRYYYQLTCGILESEIRELGLDNMVVKIGIFLSQKRGIFIKKS